MERKRFRNHFTIIIEKIWAYGVLLVTLFINQIDTFWNNLQKISEEYEMKKQFLVVTVVVSLLAIMIVYNIVVWFKTYIYIDENAIIIERKTLNKKVNVIGIKNIANVNRTQNLFERLMGTCKVKLDTNTLSTADKTDISILLKKKVAEQFETEIVGRLQQTEDSTMPIEEKKNHSNEKELFQYEASTREVIWNSICQISWVTLSIFLSTLGIVIANLAAIQEGCQGIGEQIILILICVGSGLWSVVGSFFNYYQFKVTRKADKIFLQSGFFNKVEYTIPVDKINGLVIKQTFMARLLGRYVLKVINIGSGDEKGEVGNQLVLACKGDELNRLIGILLPEYQSISLAKVEKQPKIVLLLQGIRYSLSIMLLVGAVIIAILSLKKDLSIISGKTIIILGAVIIVFILVMSWLSYRSKGAYVDETYMITVDGILGREVNVIRYDKIQYVQIKENVLSKRFEIAKGNIYLLADLFNQTKKIPYQSIFELEKLSRKVINNHSLN